MIGFRRSSTEWESSDFGGFRRVIYDYPEIKVPYKIKWDVKIHPTHEKELYFYTSEKLVKLFLLKVNQFKLGNILTRGAEQKVIKPYFYSPPTNVLVISEESLKTTVDRIISKDTELGALFDHYKKTLYNTLIYIEMDEVQEDGSLKGGDGEGEGEGEGNSKGGRGEGEDGDEDGEDGDGDPEGESNQGATPTAISMAMKKFNVLIDGVMEFKKFNMDLKGLVNPDMKKATNFVAAKKQPRKTVYTGEELKLSGQLAKVLDICFDSDVDEIKSLRAGQIDIGKIAEVPAGNFHIYKRSEEDQKTRPFSVCILADESGSMSSRMRVQLSLVKILYLAFRETLPDDRIFVYGHSDSGGGPEIRTYQDKYNINFEKTIDSMLTNCHSSNYDGPVMECIYEKVRGFTSDNILMIVTCDGFPCGGGYGGMNAVDEMKTVIEKCKRDGFVMTGLGIQHSLKHIYPYNVTINNLDDTVKLASSLVNRAVRQEFK